MEMTYQEARILLSKWLFERRDELLEGLPDEHPDSNWTTVALDLCSHLEQDPYCPLSHWPWQARSLLMSWVGGWIALNRQEGVLTASAPENEPSRLGWLIGPQGPVVTWLRGALQ